MSLRVTRARAASSRVVSADALLRSPCAYAVFLILSLRERLRARGVSRAWRDFLNDPKLWQVVDLQSEAQARDVSALLHAVSSRAAGQMRSLDVSDCSSLSVEDLANVARASRRTLSLLDCVNVQRCCCDLEVSRVSPLMRAHSRWGDRPVDVAAVRRLLRAAPRLERLDVAVKLSLADHNCFQQLFQREGCFAPVRVVWLDTGGLYKNDAGFTAASDARDEGVLAEIAAAASRHTSLECVDFTIPRASAALVRRVVDAAVAARWEHVKLSFKLLPSMSSIATLLGSPALKVLDLYIGDAWEADEIEMWAPALEGDEAWPAVCAAIRASTLTFLSFNGGGFFESVPGTTFLIDAIAGHPTLQSVCLGQMDFGSQFPIDNAAAIGVQLARLVAADTLTELNLSANYLRDDGLSPVFAALSSNLNLRVLDVESNDTTLRFAREELLPSVAANVGLRSLKAVDYDDQNENAEHKDEYPAARVLIQQAIDLVAARG